MAEASSAAPKPVTSLDHTYWKNRLPRSFQFYIDRLARGFLRVQPSNGPEFAAVLMVELLNKRNEELKNLPEVSFFDQLKERVKERGYGGPDEFATEVVSTQQTVVATCRCCGRSYRYDCFEADGAPLFASSCACVTDRGEKECIVCFSQVETISVASSTLTTRTLDEMQTRQSCSCQAQSEGYGQYQGGQAQSAYPAQSPPPQAWSPGAQPSQTSAYPGYSPRQRPGSASAHELRSTSSPTYSPCPCPVHSPEPRTSPSPSPAPSYSPRPCPVHSPPPGQRSQSPDNAGRSPSTSSQRRCPCPCRPPTPEPARRPQPRTCKCACPPQSASYERRGRSTPSPGPERSQGVQVNLGNTRQTQVDEEALRPARSLPTPTQSPGPADRRSERAASPRQASPCLTDSHLLCPCHPSSPEPTRRAKPDKPDTETPASTPPPYRASPSPSPPPPRRSPSPDQVGPCLTDSHLLCPCYPSSPRSTPSPLPDGGGQTRTKEQGQGPKPPRGIACPVAVADAVENSAFRELGMESLPLESLGLVPSSKRGGDPRTPSPQPVSRPQQRSLTPEAVADAVECNAFRELGMESGLPLESLGLGLVASSQRGADPRAPSPQPASRPQQRGNTGAPADALQCQCDPVTAPPPRPPETLDCPCGPAAATPSQPPVALQCQCGPVTTERRSLPASARPPPSPQQPRPEPRSPQPPSRPPPPPPTSQVTQQTTTTICMCTHLYQPSPPQPPPPPPPPNPANCYCDPPPAAASAPPPPPPPNPANCCCDSPPAAASAPPPPPPNPASCCCDSPPAAAAAPPPPPPNPASCCCDPPPSSCTCTPEYRSAPMYSPTAQSPARIPQPSQPRAAQQPVRMPPGCVAFEQGPDKVYFSCPSCMPTVGGRGTEARDKPTADEAVSNKMCSKCGQASKQEGAELSGTFGMIPVPSTPPPSPTCLHRGRFLNCQDSGAGSVISFAEQAAFLPSSSGGSSSPGSPGKAGAKRSPPGEVERRSRLRSSAYFPGRNSTAGVQDYGVDRRGMLPLDFIAYLHQAFPGRPFSCMQGAFSKGAPCLLPQCCCLAHLLLRLQSEDEAAARRQDGKPPPPLPPDGDVRQDPAVKDGPARTSSAPVARTRTANGPQKSPGGSPRQEASKGEVPRGVYRRNPQCPGKVWAPPPPPFFPSFAYPQGPPAAAQRGVDFHDFSYDLGNYRSYAPAYCITPHVPCIADAETQWSEQASQVGTEEEPDWSMVVEVSRKSDPDLCARCGSDMPGEVGNQESTFSSWGTSRTEPATLSKNSSEVFALDASSACPGREASTVMMGGGTQPADGASGPQYAYARGRTPEDEEVARLCEACIISALTSVDAFPFAQGKQPNEDPLCCCSEQSYPATELSTPSELPCNCNRQNSVNAPYSPNTESECRCESAGSPNREANSPYTLVSDLPDNASDRSSPVQPAPPAINVNVSVQVESAFDSNVFLEEVKRHISNAIDEVKLSQQEALKELREKERESPRPLMIGDGADRPRADSLDQYCPRHRALRLAKREQQRAGSPPKPDAQPGEEREGEEEAAQIAEDAAPSVSSEDAAAGKSSELKVPLLPKNRNQKVDNPLDPELFPRRPSEEEITKEEASGIQPRNQRRREEVCLSEVDLMNVGSCSELASPSHRLSPTEPQTEGNNVDTRMSIANALAGKRRVDRGVDVGAVEEKEAWDFILASAGDEEPRQKLSPNSTAIQTVDIADPHRYVRPQHRQKSTSVNTLKAVSSVVFNAFSSDTDAAKSKLVCLKPDVQFSPLAQRWYSKNASQLMARVQKLLCKHRYCAKRTFTHVDNLTKTGRSPPISRDSSFGHYVRQQLWQPFMSETSGFGLRLTRRHLPTDSVDNQSPKCHLSMRSYHYVNVYDAEKVQRGSKGQREWRPCLSSYPVQFYRCKSGQSVCAASPADSDRSDEATGRVGRKSSQLFDTLMENGEMADTHSGGKEPGDRSDGHIALRHHQHRIHLKDKKNKAPARAAACDDSSRQRVVHRSMVGVPGDCSHIVADRRLHGQHPGTQLKDMQQVRRNRTAENAHEERRTGRGQGFPADLPAGVEEHTNPRENVRGELSDRWQFEFDSNPNLTLSLVAAVTAIITEESPDLCMAEVMADQVVCLRTFGPNDKVPEQPGESVDSGHLRYCRALPSRQANGFREVGVPLAGLDSLKTDRKNRDLVSSVRIPYEKEEVLQPSCVNGTGVHAERTNSSKMLSKLINGLDDTEAYSEQQTGSKVLSISRNTVDDTEAHSEQMKHLGDTNIANGTLLGEQMIVLNDTGTQSAETHSGTGIQSAETHSLDDRKGLHTPERRRVKDAVDNKRDFGLLRLAVDEKCISMDDPQGLEEIVCPETTLFVTPERPSKARHPGARVCHPRKRTEGSEAMSDQPNEPYYAKSNMSTPRFPQITTERLGGERAVGYNAEHSVADFELHPDSATNLGKPDKSRENESYTVFSDCVVSSVGSSPPLTVKETTKDSYVAKASSPTAARCGGFQVGSGTSLDAVSLSEHTASSPFTETVGTSFMNTGARHQMSLTREELPLHTDGSLGEECTKKQVQAIMKRLIPDESSLHTNRASALEPVQTGDCTHATLQKVHEVNGVFSSHECVSCDDYILLSEARSRVHKTSFEQLPCDISPEEVCEGVGKTIGSGCHTMETATNALKYVSDLEAALPCIKNKPASELEHFQEHRQNLQTGLKTSILNEARAPSDGGIMSVDCTKAKKCERDPAMKAPPQNMPAGHSNVVQLLHTSGLSDIRHKMRGDKKSKRFLNTQKKLAFVKPFWAPRYAVCIVEDILLGVMQRTFDLIEEAQDRPDKTKYSDHRLILDQSTDSDLRMRMRGLWQSAPAGTRLNQSVRSVLLQQNSAVEPDLRTTMESSVLRSVEKTTDDMYQRTNTSGDAHGGYSNLRKCETAGTPGPSHSEVLSSCDTSPEAKMKTPQKLLSRSGQEEDYEEVAQPPGSRDMTSSHFLERPLFATISDTIQAQQGPNLHLQTPAYCSDILLSGSNGDREDIKPAPRPQYPQWQSCTDVSFGGLEIRQTPKPLHSPPEPRSDVHLMSNAEDQDRTELPCPQPLPSGSYGDMENIMKDHDTFKPTRPYHRPSKFCSDKPLISNIADPEKTAQLPCPLRPSRMDWIGIPTTGETAHLQNITEAPRVQHSMSKSCNGIPLVCNVENTETVKLSGPRRLPSKFYSDKPILDNDQGESEPLRARQPAPESCSKLALVCEHVKEFKPLNIRHSSLVFCGDECPADSTQDHSMKPPMDQTAVELLRPRHASSESCSDKPLIGSLEDPDKIAQPWRPQSPSVLWKVHQTGRSCDLEEITQSPRAYHPSSESCCDIRLACRPKDTKKKKPLGAHRPFTSCSDIPLMGSGKHRMGYIEDSEEIPQPLWHQHPAPAHWIGTPPAGRFGDVEERKESRKAQDLTFQSESCSDVPLACKVQDTQTTTPLMTLHSPSEGVMQPLEPQRPTAPSCTDVPQRGRKEKDTDVSSTITINTVRERAAVSIPPARKALKLSGSRASREKISAKGRPGEAGGSDQDEQSLVSRKCTAIHSVKGSALETSREECSVITKEYCNLAGGAAVQDCTSGVTSVTKATSDLLNTVYSCGISEEFRHEEMERRVQLSKSVSDSGRTQKRVELNSKPCMTKHLHPASLHGDGEQSSLSPQQWETLCTQDELVTGLSDVRLQGKMSMKESTFVFSPKDLAMLYRPGEWVSGLSDDGHHKKTRKDNLLGVEKYSVSKRPPNTKSLCAASYSSFSDWGFMTPSLLSINSLVHTLSDTALAYTQATPIVGYHGKRNSDFNCTLVFYAELLKSYQTLKTSTLSWICSVMLKAFRDELTRRNAQRKFRPQPSFSESIVGKATLSQSTRYIIDRQNNSLSDADCDSVLALQETLTTVTEALEKSVNSAKKSKSKQKQEESASTSDFPSVSKTPTPGCKQLNSNMSWQGTYGFEGVTAKQLLEIKNTITALEHCTNVYLRKTAESNLGIQSCSTCHTLPKNDCIDQEDSSPTTPTPKTRPESPNCPCTPENSEQSLSGLKGTCSSLLSEELVSAEQLPSRVIRQSRDLERFTDRLKRRSRSQEHLSNRLRPRSRSLPSKWRLSSSFDESPESRNTDRDNTSSSDFSRYGVPFETDNDLSSTTTITRGHDDDGYSSPDLSSREGCTSSSDEYQPEEDETRQSQEHVEMEDFLSLERAFLEEEEKQLRENISLCAQLAYDPFIDLPLSYIWPMESIPEEDEESDDLYESVENCTKPFVNLSALPLKRLNKSSTSVTDMNYRRAEEFAAEIYGFDNMERSLSDTYLTANNAGTKTRMAVACSQGRLLHVCRGREALVGEKRHASFVSSLSTDSAGVSADCTLSSASHTGSDMAFQMTPDPVRNKGTPVEPELNVYKSTDEKSASPEAHSASSLSAAGLCEKEMPIGDNTLPVHIAAPPVTMSSCVTALCDDLNLSVGQVATSVSPGTDCDPSSVVPVAISEFPGTNSTDPSSFVSTATSEAYSTQMIEPRSVESLATSETLPTKSANLTSVTAVATFNLLHTPSATEKITGLFNPSDGPSQFGAVILPECLDQTCNINDFDFTAADKAVPYTSAELAASELPSVTPRRESETLAAPADATQVKKVPKPRPRRRSPESDAIGTDDASTSNSQVNAPFVESKLRKTEAHGTGATQSVSLPVKARRFLSKVQDPSSQEDKLQSCTSVATDVVGCEISAAGSLFSKHVIKSKSIETSCDIEAHATTRKRSTSAPVKARGIPSKIRGHSTLEDDSKTMELSVFLAEESAQSTASNIARYVPIPSPRRRLSVGEASVEGHSLPLETQPGALLSTTKSSPGQDQQRSAASVASETSERRGESVPDTAGKKLLSCRVPVAGVARCTDPGPSALCPHQALPVPSARTKFALLSSYDSKEAFTVATSQAIRVVDSYPQGQFLAAKASLKRFCISDQSVAAGYVVRAKPLASKQVRSAVATDSSSTQSFTPAYRVRLTVNELSRRSVARVKNASASTEDVASVSTDSEKNPPLARNDVDKVWTNASAAPFHQQGGTACVRPTPQARRSCTSDSSASSPLAKVCRHGESIATDVTHTSDEDCDSGGQFLLHDASTKRVGFEDKGDSSCSESDSSVLLSDVAGCDPGHRIKAEKMSSLNESSSLHKSEVAVGEEAKNVIVQDTFIRGQRTWARQDSTDSLFLPKRKILRANAPTAPTLSDSSFSDVEAVDFHRQALAVVDAVFNSDLQTATSSDSLDTDCRSSSNFGLGNRPLHELDAREEHQYCAETETTNTMKYVPEDAPNIISYEESKNAHHDHHPRIARELQGQSSSESSQSGQSVNSDSSSSSEGRFTTPRRTGLRPASPKHKQHACQSPKVPEPRRRKSQTSSDQSNSTVPGTTSSSAGSLSWSSSSAGFSGSTGGHAADEIATAEPFLGRNLPRRACSSLQNKEERQPKAKPKTAEPWRPPSPDPAAKSDQVSGTLTESCSSPVLQMGPSLTNQCGSDTAPSRRACMELKITDDGAEKGPPDS